MNRLLLLFIALFLIPVAVTAKADPKKVASAAAAAEEEDDDEISAISAWGTKLPGAVTISIWSAKEGEAAATRIMTSREIFGISFSMGKEGKGALSVEAWGRILPRENGAFELLLEFEAEGGEADKGAMELELQVSSVLKKGETATVYGSKDDKFFVKID